MKKVVSYCSWAGVVLLLFAAPVLFKGAFAADVSLPSVSGLTSEEVQQREMLQERLRPLRERLLDPDTPPDEIQAIIDEATPLATALEQYNRRVDGTEAGEQAPPVLSEYQPASASGPADKLMDLQTIYGLFQEFMNLEARHMGAVGHPPDISEWLSLVERLTPYARHQVVFNPEGPDPLVLRATLLLGSCRLYASVCYFRKGAAAQQHDSYIRGLEILENLVLAFDTARSLHQNDPDACETVLEASPPFTGVEQAGVGSLGLTDGALHGEQVPTSIGARRRLAEYCPWGLTAYQKLHRLGLTEGLDWRILRPYADGEQPLVSVAAISRGIPRSALNEMDLAHQGLINHRGQKFPIAWRTVPPEPTFTVWFASPALFDTRASTCVGWGLKAIKLIFGGPLDLIVDETIGHLTGVVGKEYGEDSQIYLGAKVAEGLNNFGFESDFLIEGKDFAQGKPPKEILKAFLEWLEDETIKMTFDAIDPSDEKLRSQTGSPVSYDETTIPMVLLRGDLLGFERVPSHKFLRTWNFITFHQLDLRGLLGVQNADLSSSIPRRVAHAPSPSDSAWARLPDPLGTRLILGDMAPQVQVIRLMERPEVVRAWKEILDDGQTLVALLYRNPNDSRPVAFHEIEDNEISFRIMNDVQLARDGTLTNIFWPEKAKGSWGTRSARCSYTIRIGAAAKSRAYTHAGELGSRSDISWQLPQKIFSSRAAHFLNKDGVKRSGKLSFPTEACMTLDLPASTPRPSQPKPAGSGKLSGRVDQDWLTGWTKRNFLYGKEMGSPDSFDANPLVFDQDGQGRWGFGLCKYVISQWTREKSAGPAAYRRTMLSVRHTLVVTGVKGDRILGTYTSKATGKTHVFIPTMFHTRDKRNLKGLRGEGRWHAQREDDARWRLELSPSSADVPQMKIPLVFLLKGWGD